MRKSKNQKTDDNFRAVYHKDMLRNNLRRNSWKPNTSCFPNCRSESSKWVDEAYYREDSDLIIHLIEVSDTKEQYLRLETPGEWAPTYFDFNLEDVVFSHDSEIVFGYKENPRIELRFIPLSAVLEVTFYTKKEV